MRKTPEGNPIARTTDEILNDVLRTLDEIRSVLILASKDSLKKGREELLPKDSMKRKVHDLCDGTRTTSDVAKAIGKGNTYVKSYLNILRRDGLIRSLEKGGKLTHEKMF